MKKVSVLRVRQYDTEFYIGRYDPRRLVKMANPDIDVGVVQEAQRPLEKKHLMEISSYAGPEERGMLPASVMLGTQMKDKLKLEKEPDGLGGVRYFIQFPDTPEELEEYARSIDIIDGQHRLFAFSDRWRNEGLKDCMTYEMAFSLFITPDLKTRQLLFTITNEKQKAVNGNLLLYLKSQLGMLNSAEELYLPVVQLLNTENRSPLKGRIIMSAEQIAKGYKAKELIKILDRAGIGEITVGSPPAPMTPDVMLRAISVYLSGWEAHYGLSYRRPGKETMTKISGLRYTLLLFATFYDHAMHTRRRFTEEFVQSVIRDLEDMKGYENGETLFDRSLEFRGEGATVKMAMDDAAELKAYLAGKATRGFNPFEFD